MSVYLWHVCDFCLSFLWHLKLTLQNHGRSNCHSSWDQPPPPWSSLSQLWSSLSSASGQNKPPLSVSLEVRTGWLIHFYPGYRKCLQQTLMETSVANVLPSSWKTLRLLQMSTLFACPSNHPETVSVDCWTTCEPPECQISFLNLWIVNIFGQNVTFLTGHSMAEQLLSLIGLHSWLSTQNQLCGCPTTKNPDAPLFAEPNWLGRCKRLLTPFKKSDMASSGSNHTRLSLYHWFVRQKMLCVCVCRWKVGTHHRLAPTEFPPQASSGSDWQAWASVTLDWIIISLTPPPFLLPPASSLFSIFTPLHCVSLRVLA